MVLSTEKIDWREILACNSLEILREMQPADLKHKGSLGVLTVELDIHPFLTKDEIIGSETIKKQQEMEHKYETEAV